MEGFLKMLESGAFQFAQMNPLNELNINMNSVFPTVLALKEMADFTREEGNKLARAWVEKVERPILHERQESRLQKPSGQEVAKSDKETSSYTLVYFNPESKKTEVIEGNVSLEYEDETQQVIEESLGQRSTAGIYGMVATPIIREEVDERMLAEILSKIKVETPDPFGGGSAVQISRECVGPKVIEEYGEQIIAFEVAEKRKCEIEERIEKQDKLICEVAAKLDSTVAKPIEILKALPPLTRERMLALLRKKRVSRKKISELLLKDSLFLKAAGKRLDGLTVPDILQIALKLKKTAHS